MSEAGIKTRAQTRQRSQSKEPATAPALNGTKTPKTSTTGSHLEAVAEEPNSRPTLNGSQKTLRTASPINGNNMNGSHSPSSQATLNGNSSRPLSPTSMTRAQEKEELKNLNDRLSVILGTLKDSKDEIERLKLEMKTIEDDATRDLQAEIEKYRDELKKAREALDCENAEKVQLAMNLNKKQAELNECLDVLNRDSNRVVDAESRAKDAEKQHREVKRALEEACAAGDESERERVRLATEVNDLRKQLLAARGDLERETLERTEVENQLRTAFEQLQFELQLAKQRGERKSTVAQDMPDGRRSSQLDMAMYMDNFRDELEEAKQDIEEQLHENYAKQLSTLETLCNSQQSSIDSLKESANGMHKDLKEHRNIVNALNKKNRDLEDQIEHQRQKFDAANELNLNRTTSLNDQNVELNNKYQRLLSEFRNLQATNVGLSQELATYNNLLASEEARLGIETPGRPLKRKRVDSPYQAGDGYSTPSLRVLNRSVKTTANRSKFSGSVRILEVIPGKLVRIENTTNTVHPIGNWRLSQSSRDGHVAEYTFPQEQQINAHAAVSIYSSTEKEVVHDGIAEIVWTEPWSGSDAGKVTLSNVEGAEVATYEYDPEQPKQSPGPVHGIFDRIFGRT